MNARHAAAFASLAALSLLANAFEPALWMMAVKPIPTLWLACMAYRFTREEFGSTITLAVGFGALGDVLLAPMREDLFVPGALAFAVGHLFYIAAFTRHAPLRREKLVFAAPLVLYAVAIGGVVFQSMAARGETIRFVGVAFYLGLLIVTTSIAIIRQSQSPLIPVGTLIFVLSDSHIALNNLVLRKPLALLLFSGMATYYLAQYLIVRGAILESSGGREATPTRAATGRRLQQRISGCILVPLLGVSLSCALLGDGISEFRPERANWSGRWESEHYPALSGSMYFELPDPLPVGREFRVEGVSINHATLGGLLDERYDLDLRAVYDPAGTLDALDSRGDPLLEEGANLLLYGSIRGIDIKPRYAARLGGENEFLGRYNADRPYDVGEFWIVRQSCSPPCGEVAPRTEREAPRHAADQGG